MPWEIAATDKSAGVLVLGKPPVYDLLLRVHQTSTLVPERAEIATFTLRSKTPLPPSPSSPHVRCSTKPLPPFGLLALDCDAGITVTDVERARHPTLTVRSRGGPGYRLSPTDPATNRGGYEFAASDLSDAALYTGAGVGGDGDTLHVRIRFDGKQPDYSIPLLYPARPRLAKIYHEHAFDLSLDLVVDGRTYTVSGPRITCRDYEFVGDAGKSAAGLGVALTREYGDPTKSPPIHARTYYRRMFDLQSETSRAFMDAVTNATDFVNARRPPGAPYRTTPVEVACVFLSEGGIDPLVEGKIHGTPPSDLRFSGYTHLGIDSLVTRTRNAENHLPDLISPRLQSFIARNENIVQKVNESGDVWHTFETLNLEDGAHAVAAMYAACKDRFALDLANPAVMGTWVATPDDLPIHLQYFWTTLYYNGRPQDMPGRLLRHGLEYHDPIWRHADAENAMVGTEPAKRYEKYNAAWRLATFRYLYQHGK